MVTLTMSKPNGPVRGFGARREGRNVRIGGVVAPIAKELARRIEGAEYIQVEQTVEGKEETRFVALDKEGPYVRVDGEYRLLSEEPERVGTEPLYVRLDDPQLRLDEEEERLAEDEGGVFVKVHVVGKEAKVSGGQEKTVTLTGGQVEGASRGRLVDARLAGRPLYRQAWHETRITFQVPENALTGVVTVECAQLAGSPLLRVSHDPVARIAARMRPHSSAVVLDGRRSSDEDAKDKLTLRWAVDGVRRGHRGRLTVRMPARNAPYSIELTAIDAEGHEDATTLKALRLPGSTFAIDGSRPLHPKRLRAARHALIQGIDEEPPAVIEMDGYADDPGTHAFNRRLSLERVDAVLNRVLRHPKAAERATDSKQPQKKQIPVHELAYGETCQLVPGHGRQPRNRRVDVLVLGPGVTVIPPKGCTPGASRTITGAVGAGVLGSQADYT